jgi:hypothetical protein
MSVVPMFRFTEADLQKSLWFAVARPRELSCPNIYVYGSNESDFLTITKAGYVDEYEIKLSRIDFRADFKKERHEKRLILSAWHWWRREAETSVKLVGMATQYPNRFWYVTPNDLVQPDEVPEYAGLIYLQPDDRKRIVKRAPLLHREKAPPKVAARIHTAAYGRWLNHWLGYT